MELFVLRPLTNYFKTMHIMLRMYNILFIH